MYSQFLMIMLAIEIGVIDEEEAYDIMYAEGGKLLSEFEKSSFNVETEPEYECMVSFLNKKYDEINADENDS